MTQALEREQRKEIAERIEHRDTLLAIAAILKTKEGLQLFKYLFKNLEVTTLPYGALEGHALHESLGFLRAGNSIYKLACEADYLASATLIAQLEKERHENDYEQYRIEHGLYD